MDDLPEFEDPPVIEVALSVQFRSLSGLRGLAVAPLRELWRDRYPRVEEQPPLPPMMEENTLAGPFLRFNQGFPAMRFWFLSDNGTELVQLQQDRLSVNWRALESGKAYPRYAVMREQFAGRYGDLVNFTAAEGLGDLHVTQLELTYINAVTVDPGDMGKLGRVLGAWQSVPSHHLGEPDQVRVEMSFQVKDLGAGNSRLWVQAGPGQRATGVPAMLLTLLIRGMPAGVGPEGVLTFLDDAHRHLVRSFAELTTPEMQANWRWRHDTSG